MSVEKKPSVKRNMVLNVIKSIMGILFPIITFPYVSRVLGVDNIGKYNFAQTVVNYFIMFAALGISTYAVREGAKIREDKRALATLSGELFSINLCSAAAAYLLLGLCMFFSAKLRSYKILIWIFSIQILFKTIGREWIYSIYENYLFVTVRSILFQIVSLFMLFLFVKDENHVERYAIITALASAGAELINFIRAKDYIPIKITKNLNLKKHLKPVLILFAMSAAVMIYVSFDTTILGLVCDDYSVGIYSVSVKIYTVMKSVSSAALVVYIPGVSMCVGGHQIEEAEKILSEAFRILMTALLPIVVGVFVLRNEIVVLLAGIEYMESTISLSLLCISLIFCMLSGFWSQCVLVPFGKEKDIFCATLFGAAVNVGLNFVLIPLWQEKAAAFTTIISEFAVFVWCMFIGRKCIRLEGMNICLLKISAGCAGIAAIDCFIKLFCFPLFPRMCAVIGLSMVFYFGIEVLLGNEVVCSIYGLFVNKMKPK